jgi:hypothetical protein
MRHPRIVWGEDDGGDAVFRIFAMAEDERRGRCRNRKWMGDVAEAAFLYKAMEMGMVVSKPWGDNARYDFAVDTGKKLLPGAGEIDVVLVQGSICGGGAWQRSDGGIYAGGGVVSDSGRSDRAANAFMGVSARRA